VLNELVPPLDIELFMKVAGKIDPQEIYELLKLDLQYPINILKLNNKFDSWTEITQEAEFELLNKLKLYKF
jgi:hypothetical protein